MFYDIRMILLKNQRCPWVKFNIFTVDFDESFFPPQSWRVAKVQGRVLLGGDLEQQADHGISSGNLKKPFKH